MKNVLIVGAGVTGLVLALWLTKQGIPVRIIDKNSGPNDASKAIAIQARTLELYRQLNLTDKIIAIGYKNPAMNLWICGKKQVHISFGEVGAKITPYPFVLICSQAEHERLLINHLELLNIKVERQTELVSFEDKENHVITYLRTPNSNQEIYKVDYLAGCDGAHSLVRKQMNANFEGGTYKQSFYIADVEITGFKAKNEAHIVINKTDFIALIPYKIQNQSRLVGIIQNEYLNQAKNLTFDDVNHEAINSLNLQIQKVHWFSAYRVHHRVTNHFRYNQIFLLGDAAHIHSPVGGQGMNTGIIDAINLAWKLAAVVKKQASICLLDSYELERQEYMFTGTEKLEA